MTNSHIWTKYWQADRTASCFDAQGGNYEGAIKAFWEHIFSNTPPNYRCLDLCTGNGAVPLIGSEVSKKLSLKLDLNGIDQANISPKDYVSNQQNLYDDIHFTAKGNVEKLPFDDMSFDFVSSQFGVEYTSLSKTLNSAVRVLKSGGGICFVMHAKEGTVRAASEHDVNECRFLLDHSRLFQITVKTLQTLSQTEGPTATMPRKSRVRIGKAVKEFESAINMVKEREQNSRSSMHANAWRVCLDTVNKRQHFSLGVLIAKINETQAEVTAHRGRLAALVKSSQSQANMTNITQKLTELGMIDVETEPLKHKDTQALIAWVVRARKP